MNKIDFILKNMEELFPHAKCELNYSNKLELLIAVMLSAQTTDKSVNKLTKKLFSKYQNLNDYLEVNLVELEKDLKEIGLYRNKAKNIKSMTKRLETEFNGKIPNKLEELVKLEGVGRKTASVVLIEGFKIPAIPVDTHVFRVSHRLGLTKESNSIDAVEQKLRKIFPKNKWIKLHHQFIFFGRYHCLARNPKCENCPLLEICKYIKK